jgi:hypothetical protein
VVAAATLQLTGGLTIEQKEHGLLHNGGDPLSVSSAYSI